MSTDYLRPSVAATVPYGDGTYPSIIHAWCAASLDFLEGAPDISSWKDEIASARRPGPLTTNGEVRARGFGRTSAWNRESQESLMTFLIWARLRDDPKMFRALLASSESQVANVRGVAPPWNGWRPFAKKRGHPSRYGGLLRSVRREITAPRPPPIWSSFVALRRGGSVLMCRPRPELLFRDRGYHLPGGCTDPGEDGEFATTGAREFEEEIGVAPPTDPSGRQIVTIPYIWRDPHNPRNAVRLAVAWTDSSWDPPPCSDEMAQNRWVPLSEILKPVDPIRPIAKRMAWMFLT